MSAPVMRPAYLALPSSWSAGPRIAEDFVDNLATDPTASERLVLGVFEFSHFVNELAALGSSWCDIASTGASGFGPVSYSTLFTGLQAVLDYDGYRFAERAARLGPPVIVVVVNSAAAPDDPWREARATLLDELTRDGRLPPTIATVSVDPAADELARDMCTPEYAYVTAHGATAGAAAATLLLDVCARRAGGSVFCANPTKGVPNDESTDGESVRRCGDG